MESKLVEVQQQEKKVEEGPSASSKILASSSSAYSSTFKKHAPKEKPLDEHVSAAGNPTSCHFCATFNRNLYRCPRCDVAYCGLKCFKSEAHGACSEDFYRGCVKEQLEGKRAEQRDDRPLPETFEEMMKAYLSGEKEEMPGMSVTDEKGEPLYDSDDEDPNAPKQEEEDYLEKVLQGTVDGYEEEEEADIERKLMCMGVGSEMEALMAALNDDEKAAFAALAEQVYQEEQGLGSSCFRKK
ncbi:hypothetical protein PFISCL1PPCAC_9043 [Pristionchus fissidentatus]|uniref:HIT-type domain-containing protein n=1 Tax=Pristionchus fissidentatus TaxID=1538716 RepID=A0AAV5VDJ7_9BILA|nr:hypothetical protein PFISCL1PPCAC_9043 [Pristionchus fissidentatus]